jgi:Tannase and feruloyl esterase
MKLYYRYALLRVATVAAVFLTLWAPPAVPVAAANLGAAAPDVAAAGPDLEAAALQLGVVGPAMNCSDLLNQDFTQVKDAPARLDAATVVTQNTPQPYCDVTGYVASDVRFEVRLPTQGWTQRFLMLGCGGWCGSVNINTSTDNSGNAAYQCPTFASGELAVASTDMGHEKSGSYFFDGLWAVDNPGAVVDFAYLGMHKATLISKALIQTYYGQTQKYSYFDGCSAGGREALDEAQRYPDDYNGILAGSAVIDWIAGQTFYHAWSIRSNMGADGKAILTADKIPALHNAVMSACADNSGMITDPRGCHFDANSLVSSGTLTADQAHVANALWKGPVDEQGQLLNAGDEPYGSEPAWIGDMVPSSGDACNAQTCGGSYLQSFDFPNYVSNFHVTGINTLNLQFTRQEFDFLNKYHGLFDTTDPDLRAFKDHGGKLIIWQGWTDTGTSPYGALNYWDAVRRSMGQEDENEFVKLYMIPGVFHCAGGPEGGARVDFFDPLMQWVENGVAPAGVTVTYLPSATTAARTRPVFPFPTLALYTGQGDVNSASNYVATQPTQHFSDRLDWLGISHYKSDQLLWWHWDSDGLGGSFTTDRRRDD